MRAIIRLEGGGFAGKHRLFVSFENVHECVIIQLVTRSCVKYAHQSQCLHKVLRFQCGNSMLSQGLDETVPGYPTDAALYNI
jgi:hypothetical protein